MAVCEPQHGVHVMEMKSGKLLCKFILPNGENARIALSKDSITLAVGSDNGLSMLLLVFVLWILLLFVLGW